ncbi:MAG TPA: glycosyltransferase family 9 protein [Fimbriimonadaceae bacterium]|nr:glycosyltransferase family 9 protein [Fimbriimonadaceae bacterium]
MSESPRFLISRLSSLGDVVCSLPAAAALKDGFPGAHVTWVVDKRFADIVRCCRSVDQTVVWDRKPQWLFDGSAVGAGEVVYEAALDLQGLLKSALVVGRVKAKQRVGYHRQREGTALFCRRVLPDPSSIHVVDQYVDVARAIGGIADRARFDLYPDQQATERVRALLDGSPAGEFIVVNPGSAQAWKRWPVGHFAKLVDDLPLPAVLIGSKAETGGAEIVELSRTKPKNLTGMTSIGELIALIGMARAHIGGDTGSTHIAAAMDIPAIGLYSPTRPERSCPYGQISRCHFDPEDLSKIQPEEVLYTVKEALA